VTAAVPVRLNHFYVTPDRATFEAVERSDRMRELGAIEKRTTVRKDATYTALYLYGENTYLELLHPDSDSFGAPSGLAYGVETAGEILRVAAATGGEVRTVTRGEVPWFLMCRPLPQLRTLADWTMEYVPEFFARFHPDAPPAMPAIARSDALTRYAASCAALRAREQGLFEDVTALEIALPAPDLELWRARPLRVDGVELRVTRSPGRAGILAAQLRLRRDSGRSIWQLGSTTLTLDGREASWRF
jgi:hypothetical protein